MGTGASLKPGRIISYANDNFLAKMPVPMIETMTRSNLYRDQQSRISSRFSTATPNSASSPKSSKNTLTFRTVPSPPFSHDSTTRVSSGKPQIVSTTRSNTARDLRRYVANLDQLKRMFETLDKDYEEHTNIEGDPSTDIDEAELNAIIDDLEDEIDDSMGGTDV